MTHLRMCIHFYVCTVQYYSTQKNILLHKHKVFIPCNSVLYPPPMVT